ncbi:MAG: HEAT repeat domain-containing protein, partial [Cyanobacteria bacterium P01_D01_bin.73]
MRTTEDKTLLNFDDAFDSPLDHLSDADVPLPNVEEMLTALRSDDSEQRILAARAFCEIQDQRAIAPLIELLSDPCPLVRVSAAYGLGRNTSAEAIAALVERYDKEWNGSWARSAVQTPPA